MASDQAGTEAGGGPNRSGAEVAVPSQNFSPFFLVCNDCFAHLPCSEADYREMCCGRITCGDCMERNRKSLFKDIEKDDLRLFAASM